MIGIIDYGVGNVQAFINSFKRLDILACRVTKSEDLNSITHLILPGVGHFDHAMLKFRASGLLNEIEKMVTQKKIPLMGVCVGMQMLGRYSEEGKETGLGWLSGYSRYFQKKNFSNKLPLPHMGWNRLKIEKHDQRLKYVSNPQFHLYFLHSYHFEVEGPTELLASACYGYDFAAVVSFDNIIGVQCHPEKSHLWGAQILKNFSEFS